MKICTIVGARPQFIKASAVCKALSRLGITECLVDTGQHYDEAMAGSFFSELDLPRPAYNLGVGSGRHGAMTAAMLERLEPVFVAEAPDAVMVYGDTNSTLAGALAAAKLGIPVIHVEAGLRSFRRSMPEELNRRVTDHISSILLCPTATAVDRLRLEGLADDAAETCLMTLEACDRPRRQKRPGAASIVANIGDVMVDTLFAVRNKDIADPVIDGLAPKSYAFATIHRAHSTDNPDVLAGLLKAIVHLAAEMPVVFPVHPRTQAAIQHFGLGELLASVPGLYTMPPMSYGRGVKAQSRARVVITDSGGIQKEAALLGTPCLTLRDETEWTETVDAGWNRLIGSAPRDLVADSLAARPPDDRTLTCFGDGRAAERVARIVRAVSVETPNITFS